MRTRSKMLVSLCVIICALQSAQGDTLDEIAKFENCLKMAAQNLDDFISPASDIASAATAQCRPSWQAVLMVNNEPLAKLESYPSSAVRDTALNNVLTARREAVARKISPTKPETKKPNQMM